MNEFDVEEEFARLPRPKFTLAPEIVEGIRARFASPALVLFALLAGCSDSTGSPRRP